MGAGETTEGFYAWERGMAGQGMLLGKPTHSADRESIWGMNEQSRKDSSGQKLLGRGHKRLERDGDGELEGSWDGQTWGRKSRFWSAAQ